MRARNRPARYRPPAAPLPSNRPTPERERHAETVLPPQMNGVRRPWWTAASRLDALRDGGLISAAEHDAATRVRDDCERAGRSGNSPLVRIGVGTGRAPQAAGGPTGAALDAVRRIKRVRAQLGEQDFAIVVAVAVEDVPWATLGGRLGLTDKPAKARAVGAIRLLASARDWNAVTGPRRSRIRSL